MSQKLRGGRREGGLSPGKKGGRVSPCRRRRECHIIILARGGKVSSGLDNQEERGGGRGRSQLGR